MQEEARQKLRQTAEEGGYMSIGINQDGSPVRSGFVPWERTISAFNMKTPKIALAPEDLKDESIMEDLRKCILHGCYILCPLSDYQFLRRFPDICDLFILHGENIRDLSFVKGMNDLFMFYVEDAHLPNLKPLIEVCNANRSVPGKCFGFYHCEVKDVSALDDVKFILSELLIWPKEGTKDRKERWERVPRCHIFKYY